MNDATERILNATDEEIDAILEVDDILDRLRKRPRAWSNRPLDHLPNLHFEPEQHSGSYIQL